jgi:hypothetical protein
MNEILVICEGVPALFSFNVEAASTPGTAIPLHGNALHVAFIQTSPNSCTAVVSIDNVHRPGSTTAFRDDKVSNNFRNGTSFVLTQFCRTCHDYSVSHVTYLASGTRTQA